MSSSPTLASDDATEILGLEHRHSLCDDVSAPLVFLVHGRAGNSSVMWLFSRALPTKCNIISVQAPIADPIGGYSWWDIQDKEQSSTQQLSSADKLALFCTSCQKHYDLSPSTIVALGFSQGAAILSLIQDRGMFSFDRLAFLSGFTILGDRDGKNWANLPVFIAHGLDDQVVAFSTAQKGSEELEQRGANVEFVSDRVGHKVGASSLRALKNWCALI